jgi:hypothetical protein
MVNFRDISHDHDFTVTLVINRILQSGNPHPGDEKATVAATGSAPRQTEENPNHE